jgi:gluconolactonase
MKPRSRFLFSFFRFFRPILLTPLIAFAEPEFPLTEDSKPRAGVPKGEMIKDVYQAHEDSVFPGTEREYQIYLPHGFDRSKPASFMVFQDGVIYQAPVVFDNLIAKKDIPPLIGLFIKPGVVPAANENALPRFNRSYEYDSVTDTYSRFLIEEFLPAIEKKHGLKLSADPNDTAIAGNSSGGICAFMAAWHRPDRFRRVFTGVGTYVGIRGADQLPVLVRKIEPKPIRVFLQSGTGDNNLYCGDWWMANQMMERSLTWAGYDVNHAWGEGGHNQKHASQIFPEAMRWLWREWQTSREIKANPRGESRWKGYEVFEAGSEWEQLKTKSGEKLSAAKMASDKSGRVFMGASGRDGIQILGADGVLESFRPACEIKEVSGMAVHSDGSLSVSGIFGLKDAEAEFIQIMPDGKVVNHGSAMFRSDIAISQKSGLIFMANGRLWHSTSKMDSIVGYSVHQTMIRDVHGVCLSPDQTTLYLRAGSSEILCMTAPETMDDHRPSASIFTELPNESRQMNHVTRGITVDQDGRLYLCTSEGIQVCDQLGRVNFSFLLPQREFSGWDGIDVRTSLRNDDPSAICFGGKDLSEMFIACGDAIYKRPTKVRGYISGQMPPIKPALPKL